MKTPGMELLAPAGSLEAFEAAVRAGADAVYVGAPGANARALARDFTPAELAAMVEYAHARRVRVYVAMNSLLKEDELASAAATVELLAGLGIDALIVQDLGLYQLCRRLFPQLRLHASTLLGAHNSLAVEQFAAMGFARVVLARELSLPEIAAIRRQSEVELEVFVHGAMCFSYSGLCLFSSYLGGKSGLRGRCVQPCRRLYRWGDKGGDKSGYLFSMNDLDALELLPALRAAGVGSVKIEGRMKSAHYVDRVVQAYRLVLDALEAGGEAPPAEALAAGRALLGEAMGRRTGAGFFQLPAKELIAPAHSGNVGLFLGKIAALRDQWAILAPRHPLQKGDRLRLHREGSGERLAFTVKEWRPAGPLKKMAAAEGTVEILLPEAARPGDSIYKVDLAERRRAVAQRELVVRESHRRLAATLAAGKARLPARDGARAAGRNRAATLPLWLKLDDHQLLKQRLPDQVERVVLPLSPESLPRLAAAGPALRAQAARIIWALPPVILEDELPFYREQIAAWRAKGFEAWQVGHLGQVRLFAEGAAARPVRRRGRTAPLTLHGDHTLNILNSLAWDTCRQAGLSTAQAAVEADRKTMARLGPARPGLLGMTIYGRPPLFTARLDSVHFRYHTPFFSPRGESFVLTREFGQTLALAEKPFSLLPYGPELAAFDLAYGVVDLRRQKVSRSDLLPLLRQAGKKSRARALLSSFNYLHGLD